MKIMAVKRTVFSAMRRIFCAVLCLTLWGAGPAAMGEESLLAEWGVVVELGVPLEEAVQAVRSHSELQYVNTGSYGGFYDYQHKDLHRIPVSFSLDSYGAVYSIRVSLSDINAKQDVAPVYAVYRQRMDAEFGQPVSVMGTGRFVPLHGAEDYDESLQNHSTLADYPHTETIEDYAFYAVQMDGKNVWMQYWLKYTEWEQPGSKPQHVIEWSLYLPTDEEWEDLQARLGVSIPLERADAVSDLYVPLPTASPAPAVVASGVESAFSYAVTEQNTVTITGYTGAEQDIRIPGQIGGMPVTSIGEEAFYQKKIARVQLPETVTVIGDGAFRESGVTRVNLPDGLHHIGAGAFAGAAPEILMADRHPVFALLDHGLYHKESKTLIAALSGIEKVPQGVTAIGDGAFQHWRGQLPMDLLPDSVTRIGSHAFEGASFAGGLALPEKLESIGEYAFSDARCNARGNLNAPVYGFSSTYNYANLSDKERVIATTGAQTSDILAGRSKRSSYSFYDASVSFRLPRNLLHIGAHAFHGFRIEEKEFSATGDERIHNRNAVCMITGIRQRDIPEYCFCGFSVPYLEKLMLPAVEQVGDHAFQFVACDISLPASVKTVGDHAFASGRGQAAVLGSVEQIGAYSFQGRWVDALPDTLKIIGEGAFASSAMKEITLPAALEQIGDQAFPQGITLKAREGSYAWQWARDHGYWYESAGGDSGGQPAAGPDTDWLNN